MSRLRRCSRSGHDIVDARDLRDREARQGPCRRSAIRHKNESPGSFQRNLANFPELPATPFRVGAHLSTPIVLNDGRVYGTLCCFSHAANPSLTQQDLRKLELSAKLTAQKIDARRAQEGGALAPANSSSDKLR